MRERVLTLPDEVCTVSKDCSTDCRNLSTFFQLPPHLARSSPRAAGPMTEQAMRAAHNREAACSARGRRARQVPSSLARSPAASLPELSTSPMRWPGNSSMEKARGDFSPAMDPPPQLRGGIAVLGVKNRRFWCEIDWNHPKIRTSVSKW